MNTLWLDVVDDYKPLIGKSNKLSVMIFQAAGDDPNDVNKLAQKDFYDIGKDALPMAINFYQDDMLNGKMTDDKVFSAPY